MPIQYSEGTVLKRTAAGAEVLSNQVDTDAGETRLGAFLNLDGPGNGGQSDGEVDAPVTGMTPDNGPYNAATQVVFTGTFTNSGPGNYAVQVLIGEQFVTGAVNNRTDTELTATLPAGSDTDGLLSGPAAVMVAVAERPAPGEAFAVLDDPQPYTYT